MSLAPHRPENSHQQHRDTRRVVRNTKEHVDATARPLPERMHAFVCEELRGGPLSLPVFNSVPQASSPQPLQSMGFLCNAAGLFISLPLTYAISRSADLQLYAAVCIGVQWLSCIYAIPKQDERFFDLTGSITFATVSLLALVLSSSNGATLAWRSVLLTAFVWLWCVRLGSFLYLRIREVGEDTRFAKIRVNPVRFFSVWSIQGLWVFLTALPVLLSLAHSTKNPDVCTLDIVGAVLWVLGYAIEVLADYQKTQFRRDARNKGKFIQSGLWKYSRHPNYLGEITMWVGIFLIAVHGLPSALYKAFAALSPVFVTLLLTKVSGIPLLEKQGDERWGSQKAYQEYKKRTSVLLLWPTTSV